MNSPIHVHPEKPMTLRDRQVASGPARLEAKAADLRAMHAAIGKLLEGHDFDAARIKAQELAAGCAEANRMANWLADQS